MPVYPGALSGTIHGHYPLPKDLDSALPGLFGDLGQSLEFIVRVRFATGDRDVLRAAHVGESLGHGLRIGVLFIRTPGRADYWGVNFRIR